MVCNIEQGVVQVVNMTEAGDTSIRIKQETKVLLDGHKIISEEPYDKVVRRLAVLASETEKWDDEGLLKPEYAEHLRQRLRLRSQDRVVAHASVRQRLKERQKRQDGGPSKV